MIEMNDKKVRVLTFQKMKRRQEKISMLTAYDYQTALILDSAGIDGILIGDSVANVFCGDSTTLTATLDQMIYHAKAVTKAVKRALTVLDMPFMSYQVNIEDAIRNAGRVLKESGVESVKIEGSRFETVEAIVKAGIPVMGHLGFTAQSIHQLGGARIQGKSEAAKDQLVADACDLEAAGCYALVLEMIPSDVARRITEALTIPTIGIGAGVVCDGQILVINDIIGMFEQFQPKFVKRYAQVGQIIRDACIAYCGDVKSKQFPAEEHTW